MHVRGCALKLPWRSMNIEGRKKDELGMILDEVGYIKTTLTLGEMVKLKEDSV